MLCHRLQVYPTDAPELMSWGKAIQYAINIGDNWRLSYLEELAWIFRN